MSLPRYPEYKDSGVEWLGEVPAHWTVAPLKRGFDVRLGKMLQPAQSSDEDVLAPYLRAANIQWGGVDLEDVRSMWFSPRERELLALQTGDLLVSEGGDVGRSSLWRAQMRGCYFQNSVNRVRARGQDRTDYLYYWMATIKAKGYVDVLCNKSTIAHFTAEKVAAVPTIFPEPEEQRQIAAFLDRETAKIDALIAEQEKLLALLAEKRQATISHAVTRGLDPNVTMKDSGIPWLGAVPAHWEVSPLKYISRIGNGSTPNRDNPDYWSDTGFPWLNSSVVNQDEVSEAERFVTELALKECHLPVIRPPTVLVGITGQGKTRGMAAPLMFEATINQHLAYITPKAGRLEVAYLLRALEIAYVTLRTDSESAGSTKGAITCDQLSRFTIPLPPLDEQGAIAKHIDIKAAHFEKLASDSRQAIALLKERRSALIAAAVTGQIDARGAVESQAA
ncbi:restriction endonuclease subunit S [Luteimonas sp. MJ293]|uniref:restriction endonuclease subunit S n=1 Tax=Luteimonas sp. MJ146 TaxID=3129240 RepID=UPI0031BB5270